MHKEILTNEQIELLSLLKAFSEKYYLVGGTAIALYLGHRQSIDFDLFSEEPIKRRSIKNAIEANNFHTQEVIYEAFDQMHLIVSSVKITFFNYPFRVIPHKYFDDIIQIPSLLDLAAMKAYALGGRARWKDYVDLYFILKEKHSLKEISKKARQIFQNYYNEKLFREQLSYFEDLDYSEDIRFIGNEIKKQEIKEYLQDIATEEFK